MVLSIRGSQNRHRARMQRERQRGYDWAKVEFATGRVTEAELDAHSMSSAVAGGSEREKMFDRGIADFLYELNNGDAVLVFRNSRWELAKLTEEN